MMLTNPRTLVVGFLLVAGAGLAIAMTPTERVADAGRPIDLEAMVPRRIGDWRIDTSLVPIEPNPEEQALLDRVYNQTLSRTYVNSAGQRIMLSIAFSADQSDHALQIHRPEVCYAAHGFDIQKDSAGTLVTQFGKLSVERLLAVRGARSEPVTYWLLVGHEITRFGLDKRLVKLRYGLQGKVPDGFLVRVSSISSNLSSAYALQDAFISAMLISLKQEDRSRIVGRIGS